MRELNEDEIAEVSGGDPITGYWAAKLVGWVIGGGGDVSDEFVENVGTSNNF